VKESMKAWRGRRPGGRPRAMALLCAAAASLVAAQAVAAQGAAAQAAGSQGPLVLGVDEAVALALKDNLDLASERIDAAAKKRAHELSWNSFLPTVDVGATLGRLNEANEGSGLLPMTPAGGGLYEQVLPYSYSIRNIASGSLNVQLVLNAALFEGIRSLRLDYEAGLVSEAQATKRLERDVRKNFYSIRLLEENMRLMERSIDAAERRYGQAVANYKTGLAPELAMLQARVAWENMKPALEEMKVGYAASLDAFAMILGLPRGKAIELRGDIAPAYAEIDADSLARGRIGDRLDIQSINKRIETLTSNERALRYQLWTPSLALGWSADPALAGDALETSWFKDGAWAQSSGMLRATLTFRLNGLLPQSREAQNLAELRDGIEKARTGLAQAIRGAEIEIDGLARKLAKSRASAAALALNVELAERAYRLAEEAYRSGSEDLLDVQAAELELQKAQLEVLKENYNYVTGVLDLEYAANLPFGSLVKEGAK